MKDAVTDDFSLGIAGFTFADLYEPRRLSDLHRAFWNFAADRDPDIAARFATLDDASLPAPQVSERLIEVAAILGDFMAVLFDIQSVAEQLRDETLALEKVFQFKQDFLRTRVFKNLGQPPIDDAAFLALDEQVRQLVDTVPSRIDPEIRFADTVLTLLAYEKSLAAEADDSPHELARRICAARPETTLAERVQQALRDLGDWCVQVNASDERRRHVDGWVSFVRPATLDYEHLVQIERPSADLPETIVGPVEHHRLHRRRGNKTGHRPTFKYP